MEIELEKLEELINSLIEVATICTQVNCGLPNCGFDEDYYWYKESIAFNHKYKFILKKYPDEINVAYSSFIEKAQTKAKELLKLLEEFPSLEELKKNTKGFLDKNLKDTELRNKK